VLISLGAIVVLFALCALTGVGCVSIANLEYREYVQYLEEKSELSVSTYLKRSEALRWDCGCYETSGVDRQKTVSRAAVAWGSSSPSEMNEFYERGGMGGPVPVKIGTALPFFKQNQLIAISFEKQIITNSISTQPNP
jgi:hypothetical protein